MVYQGVPYWMSWLLDRQAQKTWRNCRRGRLREKRELLIKALTGQVKPHHRFVLSELLCQIDSLDETIARSDEEIVKYCRPFEDAVALLDTIPGVARLTAEVHYC